MKTLPAAFTWERLGWALLTLALGAVGGFLFVLIGVPAAFLSGPMVAVAVCAVLRVPVDLPMPLRDVAFVVPGAFWVPPWTRKRLPRFPSGRSRLPVC